jgi:hypothetical protein
MATRDGMDRKSDAPAERPGRLRRIGVWTGFVLLAAVSLTVFAVCACKTFGR